VIKLLIVIVVAVGGVFLIGPDAARYLKMRDMSGDPPKRRPHVKTLDETSAGVGNPLHLIASIPSDISRYLKMKSM
jgi:hypothetical protein